MWMIFLHLHVNKPDDDYDYDVDEWSLKWLHISRLVMTRLHRPARIVKLCMQKG